MTPRTRKRVIFLCATLVLLGGAGFGAVTLRRIQRDRALERSLTEGLAAYQSKEYPVALEKLAYYVGRRPEDGPAVLSLAKTRWKIPTENGEHLGSAARYAQAAAKAMPDDPAPLEMLLSLYQEMGYYTERIETAERLLKLDPRHLGALKARAESQILKNAKDQAVASSEAWAALAPDSAEAHSAVIQAKRLAGRPTEEIAAYVTRVAQEHPNDFRFAVFQASMNLDVLNDRPAAIAAIKQALAMTPSDATSLSALVLVLDNFNIHKDDPSLAGAADRLLAFKPTDLGFAAEIAAIGAKRDFKLLVPVTTDKWLGPIVAAGDAAPDSALGIALFLAGLDDNFKVPASLRETLAKRSTSTAEAWQMVLKAQERLKAVDAPAARRDLIAAGGLDSSNDTILFLISQADAQLGEWRRAGATLNSLAAADPSWAIARKQLITLLLQTNQVYDAYIQASAAYLAHPRLGEAYRLGEASVRVANATTDPDIIKRAQEFVDKFVTERPDDPVVIAFSARMHALAGRRDAAVKAAKDVLAAKGPLATDTLLTLADAIRPLDTVLASSIIAQAKAADPNNPDIALADAESLAFADPAAAEAALEKILASQTGREKDATLRRIAAFLDRRGDPRALERLKQVAADNPTDPAAQMMLLNSISAWKEEPAVAAAIKRYRDICGDDTTLGRTFEARRLMVFTPGADYASRAVQLLDPVVTAGPGNASALALLAEANRILGDPGKAVEYLNRAVDANAADPTFYPPLIANLDRAGRRVEARRRMDAFVALAGVTNDVRRERAQLLVAQERWAESAADYAALGEAATADDRVAHAQVLTRAGKPDEASMVLSSLVTGSKPSAKALVAAAELAASQGRVDEGFELLKRLPPDVSPSDRLAVQASYLEKNRRTEAAQALYEEAAKDGNPDRAADLALFYLRRGEPDRAARIATEAIKKAPDHKRLLALSNVARVKQGGSLAPGALSATLASFVTDEDPKAMEQWLGAIALLEVQPPNRSRYLAEIDAITRNYPRFYPGWHTLVIASIEDRNVDGVVRAARGVLAALPDQPRAARLATEALAACGKTDEAADAAAQWQRLTAADPFEADMELARIQLLRSRDQDARTLAQKWGDRAIGEADRLPAPFETYLSTLVKTGEAAKARDLILAKAKDASKWIPVYLRVASLNAADVANQRSWAKDAAALRLDATAQLTLGTFWHDLAARTGAAEDLAESIKILSAIKSDDKAILRDAALLLASCYQARNEPQEAQNQYRRVLQFNPTDALTLNNLAYLVMTYSGSIQEAANLAEQAVSEAARQGLSVEFRASTLDTLGQVQIRQKRGAAALTSYEQATKLNANDISLWVGLVEAQVLSERLSDAKVTFDRVENALRTNPPTDPALLARIAALRERLGLPPVKKTSG